MGVVAVRTAVGKERYVMRRNFFVGEVTKVSTKSLLGNGAHGPARETSARVERKDVHVQVEERKENEKSL